MRTLRARSPDPGWATDRRPRAHGNGDELCAKETGHGRGDRCEWRRKLSRLTACFRRLQLRCRGTCEEFIVAWSKAPVGSRVFEPS
jgi:hypothetical protein